MSKLGDFRNVVQLACFTEDRSAAEQRSMLAVSMHVDQECAAFTSWNRDLWPPDLTVYVMDTYDPSEGRRSTLTSSQRDKLDRMQERWSLCVTCRAPMGAHAVEGHPQAWWATMACLRDVGSPELAALREAGWVA